MRVKRYLVDTMPDAMQKIRSELGKDAVILNTKEVKTGGFLGLFSKKKIEVIAAIDSASQSSSSVKSTTAVSGNQPPVSMEGKGRYPMNAYASIHHGSTQPKQAATQESQASAVALLEQEMDRQAPSKAAVEQNQPAESAVNASSAKGSSPETMNSQLWTELRQLKEMLNEMNQDRHAQRHALPVELIGYQSRLKQHGVSESLVKQIMKQASETLKQNSDSSERAARSAVEAAIHAILSKERVQGVRMETKIVNIVGPTGVGKTTTIAKLAAEQVLRHHRKVGFITSDTYRIAAVDQLRTYANILNVPMEVVFSPQEFVKAFEKLQDCDLIFMDTAGRNYRNEMYVSELNSLLAAQKENETFLVLSISAKYEDMKVITENFSKFKLDKVLFTKMDETDSYGSILNLAHDFPLQFSYLTNGQNVPQDIEKLDVDRLIDKLLGEQTDG
ncbi:flagellar biosynthesis protein FlhF [Marinicrinis sediminis]|uniref:Flagellar biosynthesis protein FlhF n=1 Tax=Marinicrinis sediminis TaxID=1652465 RepID=A0ABW5R5U5_9BACL